LFVGIAKISLVIGESHSLKDKRTVLRRIQDRVRERLSVTLNEVGEQDIWQRAELGCAVVSAERQKAQELLDAVANVALAAGGAQIVAIAKDVHRFQAVAAPFVAVDDRTGAGDKAQSAQGDWMPDEWREEAQT
jgi:uncharacterized protein YlxP (DUF503 family)